MAAMERRVGVSRRGMTVLGKVPVAPRPINLPSQRSTFCWGSAGKFGGLSGKFDSALLNPVSSDEKVESRLVTPTGNKNHGDGVGLQENRVQSLSVTARANSLSSGAANTTTLPCNNARKMEEPRNACNYNCNSSESLKLELTDPPLQKSGDCCSRGVSAPPGFSHNGPHGNSTRLGTSSVDSQCNGVGNGMHSDSSQQNGSHSIPGMPYRSGTKDREIIVIHMVGSPGFYGNYPPQFGFPESYNRNGGVVGNFPLQFGNFEPFFGLQGQGRLDGGAQLSAATGSVLFDEHEDFVCYEKECYRGACHDLGRHRNSWMRGNFRENYLLGGAQGDVYDSLIPGSTPTVRSRSLSQRHFSKNAGRSRSSYRNGRVVSMEESIVEPVAEKRITLLTKVSQHHLLAKDSFKEIRGDKDARNSVDPVSSACLNEEFCEDEGKAPLEILEARKVTEDPQVETSLSSGVSIHLEMIDEVTVPKESTIESILLSKTTCNEKCLHCKGDAVMGGSATLVCQACEKTTVCESNFSTWQCCLGPTEEVPVASVGKDSCIDGCKAEVKHVILDADNYTNNTINSEVVSKEQEIAMDNNNSSTARSNNSEVLKVGTRLSSDTSFKKSTGRQQKLVFKKKSQMKSMTNPGIRVSKAHVVARKPGFQGSRLTNPVSSTSSSDPKESLEASVPTISSQVATMQQDDAVRKNSFPLASQLSHPKVSRIDTSLSSVAPSKKNSGSQQKLFYRKRLTEQAAIEPLPIRESSKIRQPIKSLSASSQAELGIEHEKDIEKLTPSEPAFKYHIIRRRVYHVVDGSEGDYHVPTDSLSSEERSCQFSSVQQLEEKTVPTSTTSSHQSESEIHLLQKSESENKSSNACSEVTSPSAVHGLQPLRSSSSIIGREDNATKKHVKSSRQSSAWKPKVALQTAGLGNGIGKEKESGSSASTLADKAPEGKTGSLCSGLVGVWSSPHLGNVDERHSVGTPDELSSESKSSSSGPSECEDNHTFQIKDKYAEKSLESMVAVGEVKRGSVLTHAEELPPLGLTAPVIHDNGEALALNQVKQTCSQDIIAGNHKPFMKKNVMNYEKADQYHQILFKRYKEIGQWKPKADLHKKSLKRKENVCAS